MNSKKTSTQTLVLGAVLTALVVVLQLMGSFIKLGPFSISLVLIPIVIGAATCGTKISTFLGFVFGIVVLASGDASAFLAVSAPGTVITVLCKGLACGFIAGLVYRIFAKHNQILAVVLSAVLCPITNTGVFLIGCLLFFMETVTEWAVGAGFGTDAGKYMIFGLVGANFLVELATNVLLSPIVVRLLKVKNNQN